jgi:hypothetical protein
MLQSQKERNQLILYQYTNKMLGSVKAPCTLTLPDKDSLTKGTMTFSFRSYTLRLSIPFKFLFCQMEDGTEPLNALFAIDLTWRII